MITKHTIKEFSKLLDHKYRKAKHEYRSGINHGIVMNPCHYRRLGYLTQTIKNYDDSDVIMVSPTGRYNIYQGARLIKYGRFIL